jgi:putative addiction module component (TIGR02574 family)
MAGTLPELETLALRLTREERARLADRLLASLSTDSAIDEAWSAEAQRRLAELEAGTVQAAPIEAAIERARQAIR